MNKAIVTGGLGFIGFHLCDRLLQEGVETIAVDDAQTTGEVEEKQLFFGRNALFSFWNMPLEEADLDEMAKDCDVIFHLAQRVPPDVGLTQLDEMMETEKNGIKTIVDAAKKMNATVIFPSTTDVYEKESKIVTETDRIAPKRPFAKIKAKLEQCLDQYAQEADVSFITLRMPEVYGPWQQEEGSYRQLMTAVLQDKKLPEFTDGKPDDVIFVADVTAAFIAAANGEHKNAVFNIASGKRQEWDKGKQVITEDDCEVKQTNETDICFSIEKAKHTWAFVPKVDIYEGIKQQIEHLKRNLLKP